MKVIGWTVNLCSQCDVIGYPCEFVAGGHCDTGHLIACGPSRRREHCTWHDGPVST